MNIIYDRSCSTCGETTEYGVFKFDITSEFRDGLICGPCMTGLFDEIGVPDKVRAAILEAQFAQLVKDGRGHLFNGPADASDENTVTEEELTTEEAHEALMDARGDTANDDDALMDYAADGRPVYVEQPED